MPIENPAESRGVLCSRVPLLLGDLSSFSEFPHHPCTESGFCLNAPPEAVSLLPELKAVVTGYADDHVIGIDLSKQVSAALLSQPTVDRTFVTMTPDDHGAPPISAGHGTTYNGNARGRDAGAVTILKKPRGLRGTGSLCFAVMRTRGGWMW